MKRMLSLVFVAVQAVEGFCKKGSFQIINWSYFFPMYELIVHYSFVFYRTQPNVVLNPFFVLF